MANVADLRRSVVGTRGNRVRKTVAAEDLSAVHAVAFGLSTGELRLAVLAVTLCHVLVELPPHLKPRRRNAEHGTMELARSAPCAPHAPLVESSRAESGGSARVGRSPSAQKSRCPVRSVAWRISADTASWPLPVREPSPSAACMWPRSARLSLGNAPVPPPLLPRSGVAIATTKL